MAAALSGVCLRHRFAGRGALAAAPAIFWIVEADLDRVCAWHDLAPQFFDVINPAVENRETFYKQCRAFRHLILNTESTVHFLGDAPHDGWKSWVIPHHHCNFSNFQLAEDRLEKPKVVGYVGDPVHLHDTDIIRSAVEALGMKFLNAPTAKLAAYQEMDIGVAWTRRDTQRDLTRSNIKLVNFAAHGIPSVLCDYESYRSADAALGGGACLIRDSLADFLEGLRELVTNEDLRRKINQKGILAQTQYSVAAIADRYREVIAEQTAL